ncbi:unnamed protein product [Moneuplotes crassus]|uniref:Uncharacterized protein n=1 Tax=Euplotes crassus TaxID=5936 RepID=A0AAD1YA62_EUPCR|nr:unnamed protein product [Moneuplotes crassus]
MEKFQFGKRSHSSSNPVNFEEMQRFIKRHQIEMDLISKIPFNDLSSPQKFINSFPEYKSKLIQKLKLLNSKDKKPNTLNQEAFKPECSPAADLDMSFRIQKKVTIEKWNDGSTRNPQETSYPNERSMTMKPKKISSKRYKMPKRLVRLTKLNDLSKKNLSISLPRNILEAKETRNRCLKAKTNRKASSPMYLKKKMINILNLDGVKRSPQKPKYQKLKLGSMNNSLIWSNKGSRGSIFRTSRVQEKYLATEVSTTKSRGQSPFCGIKSLKKALPFRKHNKNSSAIGLLPNIFV